VVTKSDPVHDVGIAGAGTEEADKTTNFFVEAAEVTDGVGAV